MKETKLKIVTWPNKILRKKCKKVENINEDIIRIFNEMYKVMVSSKGIGLAANQVGLDLSLIIIEFENKIFKLVNPKIIKKEGRIRFREGCLSFPNIELDINRAKKVWVEALDEHGNELNLELENTLAVVFQHEIDHINGITFIYRVPFFKRLKVLFKLKKMLKNGLLKQEKES